MCRAFRKFESFYFTALFALVLVSLMLFSRGAEARFFVAEPMLIAQPTYAGMQFYVYRPYNMPRNWYLTFDGYPVTRNYDGVWVYGNMAGPNLIATNYIVGSVVPSMAGLSMWARPAHVSSVVTVPSPYYPAVVAAPAQYPVAVSVPAVYPQQPILVQQAAPAPVIAGPAYSTWVPDWSFNPRFMAMGTWKSSVDRIGVLHNPAIPVAWKGSYPKVIYAWTGKSWHQINMKEYERPVDALKNSLYDLVRMVKRSGFVWYEPDTPVLAQLAAQWGYYWMGEFVPSR